jgi:hypothetical protein
MSQSVLSVGFIPERVDLTPFPGLTPEKVRAGVAAELARLKELGYDAHHVYLDVADGAESVLGDKLAERSYAGVVVGAGIRNSPAHFLMFERILNVIHEKAPHAKICFNTSPHDTSAAIQRWVRMGNR